MFIHYIKTPKFFFYRCLIKIYVANCIYLNVYNTYMFKKVQERRLQWYGHVMRREADYVGKRVMGMAVEGTRGRGRPRRRWMDNVNEDLTEKGLTGDEVRDRSRWKQLTRNVDPA